jgi:hypothetical protein
VALTVTATAGGAQSFANICLAVRVVNNASLTQPGATANSETATTPQLAITPHASGSLVYGSVLTGASSAGFTGLNANTTSLFNGSLTGDGTWNFGLFKSAGTTTTSPATYGWTGASESSGTIYIAQAEILAAGGTIAEDASTPAVVSTSSAKTITTASFTPPAASVVVAMTGTDWTGGGTVTMTVTDSASAYNWSQLSGTGTGDLNSVWVGIPKTVTVSGLAGLFGEGTLGAGRTHPGAGALAGEGTLGAAAGVTSFGAAGLNGQGGFDAAANILVPGAGASSLSGQGTLAASPSVTWAQTAGLGGQGTLSGQETGLLQQTAGLSGQGALGFTIRLGLLQALFGAGSLSIPQVAGGLVNGVGGAGTPQALPGSSQVAVAPPGSSNWQWLGTLGQVTALTYSYICPGGPDKMQMTLMVPAAYRTQLFNPGWKVKITRGGHQVWDGILDEPQPGAQGWTLTAVGTGNLGTNYVSFYSIFDVWPQDEPDEIVNRAIARGLPWVNPGLNSSPLFSQFWFGQAADPASQTVTDFLNLICTRGGLLWYVNSQPGGAYGGDDLSVFPLPVTAGRLLVCTTPVARTLGGYVNTIFARYMLSADNTTTSAPAAYQVNETRNLASVAAHGPLEAYIDLSDVGVMTAAQVNTLCNSIFAAYEAASFAGPFQASYGQLLNTGGAAVDPGTDQAGSRVRLVLTQEAYGGEVVPGPVEFTVGSYSWDDFKQVATITPLQVLNQSLSGMLSAWNTVNVPPATAG